MSNNKQYFFQTAVNKYFQPLISDYNYWIKEDQRLSPEIRKYVVLLISTETGIEFVLERGSQILVQIGQASIPREDWFEFTDVIEHFSPGTIPYEFSNHPDLQIRIETQLQRLARLMFEFCMPILLGDFSMQEKIKSLEDKRVHAMLDEFTKLSRKQDMNNGK